ncbi:MAG TPA: glycosyltransferase family 2 protein [Candidatus Acidoferrum sp.]|nr:glycosyltransferase family 2 protein [Candidatus Acidoferrum sp.]
MATPSSNSPLISVVIPTYNRPHYLREAIASALAQTYTNIEVLVRDNASGDETRRVVMSFRDPRIHYHRHDSNVGQTRNVIAGCIATRGKYVANLHDDDVWEPDFLAKLVRPLEENAAVAIAFSDHYIIDAEGALDPAMTRKNTRHWKRHMLTPGLHAPLHRIAVVDMSIPLSMASLMRRSAIDWSDVPDLPSCYDVWLMYLVSRDGQAGYYVPERLTRYRVHSGSETAIGRMRVDQGFVMCCDHMLVDERMRSVWPEIQLELARACADLGLTLARQGRTAEGRPYLRRSLQLRWTLRGLTLYGMSFSPSLLSGRNGISIQKSPAPALGIPGNKRSLTTARTE